MGIELLDFGNRTFYSGGDTLEYYIDTEVKYLELKEGERLLGVKYGSRKFPNRCYPYDVQFTLQRFTG